MIPIINSKIIDTNNHQQIHFIQTSLNHPTHIQLLYRASQHNFCANKFHQKCDNVEGTLTIIYTEFGKVIGGFTPLRWNQKTSGNYAADHTKTSFLFSLSKLQKMTLIKPQEAIYCKTNCGPIFGAGYDIILYDKCNLHDSNYANFPYSYNSNEKYASNQQTYTAFCGAIEGKHFKVLEYEVFKVVE